MCVPRLAGGASSHVLSMQRTWPILHIEVDPAAYLDPDRRLRPQRQRNP